MRVQVLYFGVLKERFGAAGEAVQLADGATVGDLVRELQARTSNPAMSSALSGADSDSSLRLWQSLAIAVNREYAALDTVLREGDEVALLPPVSGGYCACGERLTSLAVADRAVAARALLAAERGR